ncbi:MAG: YihY/virulence factor BrkB family protein [Bacteroidaceae bacterium]|nr:YihY/virulence factor BrkB family protein [Bacteroidaceae bacterium]
MAKNKDKEEKKGLGQSRWSDIIQFFRKDRFWSIDLHTLPRPTRILMAIARRLEMTYELFMGNNLSSQAAALTYSSILGAVPILAIVFAIARGFGFGSLVEDKLKENVRFSPEITQTLLDFVNSYLEKAKGGVFIGVGLIMLFYTLINLTSNIELSFNTIWRVKTSRNIYRRAVNYISIFFILPILIVVTSGFQIFIVGASHFLPSYRLISEGIQLSIELIPYTLTSAAFIVLYKMMPNTEVKWKNVIVPGIISGVCFQALQWFYINSQVWISSYNAIYGSFAAIPLFMLWMQLSWTICLLGAQLSYAHQMVTDFAFEKSAPLLCREYHDCVAMLIMTRLCKEHDRGKTLTAHEISVTTSVPISLVNSILYELMADEEKPLVNEVTLGNKSVPHFAPAIAIDHICVSTVLNYMDKRGNILKSDLVTLNPEWRKIQDLRTTAITAPNTKLKEL